MKKVICKFAATAMIIAVCALAGCQVENVIDNEAGISKAEAEEIAHRMMAALAALPDSEIKIVRVYACGDIQAVSFYQAPESFWMEMRSRSATRSTGDGWRHGSVVYYTPNGLNTAKWSVMSMIAHSHLGFPFETQIRRECQRCFAPWPTNSARCNFCNYPKTSPWISIYHRSVMGFGGVPECPPIELNMILLLPDPNDCSIYFRCENGWAIPSYCPVGLYFCEQLNACTWRWDYRCFFICLGWW